MRTTIIAITLLTVLAVAVLATTTFKKVFDTTYKPAKGSELAKAGCAVCHVKGDNKKFNPYGEALKGKAAAADSLKKVEKLDSDKDGISNIDEIKSGTLPGDSKNKPKIADYDPVCKMKVDKSRKPAGGVSTYKGITYYFCNPKCKELFDKTPEKYLK